MCICFQENHVGLLSNKYVFLVKDSYREAPLCLSIENVRVDSIQIHRLRLDLMINYIFKYMIYFSCLI